VDAPSLAVDIDDVRRSEIFVRHSGWRDEHPTGAPRRHVARRALKGSVMRCGRMCEHDTFSAMPEKEGDAMCVHV
jgi:hypothetical protein